jgi:hypothetical protein
MFLFLFLLKENPSHVLKIEARRGSCQTQTEYLKGGGDGTSSSKVVADRPAIGRDYGTSHTRCAGPTPHDISQMDSSAEFGTGGSPTIWGKEVER